ncbi:MAG TPA: hypothetical protein VGM98_16245 [Schlesneria sp.]
MFAIAKKKLERAAVISGKKKIKLNRPRGQVIRGAVAEKRKVLFEVKVGHTKARRRDRAKGPSESLKLIEITTEATGFIRRKLRVSEIDQQYAEFDRLNEMSELNPDDATIQVQIAACLGKLRHLQQIEASVIENRAYQSLHSPIGRAQSLLNAADVLIVKYGHLASGNASAE